MCLGHDDSSSDKGFWQKVLATFQAFGCLTTLTGVNTPVTEQEPALSHTTRFEIVQLATNAYVVEGFRVAASPVNGTEAVAMFDTVAMTELLPVTAPLGRPLATVWIVTVHAVLGALRLRESPRDAELRVYDPVAGVVKVTP